jgi:glycosyltransferase involved in cell wall biosynthesis
VKILHLVHRAPPFSGGAERYVHEHARAGARWGHESVIASTDAWDMAWMVGRHGRRVERRVEKSEGIEIRRFSIIHPPAQDIFRAALRRLAHGGKDRFLYPNPFVPSLGAWLSRDRGFDLVHSNAMPFALYWGFRHASRFGAALASVPHANVGEKYRRVEALHYFEGRQKDILRSSSLVVAQSEFEKGLYLEMGVDEERVLVLGSGVDPREFEHARGDRGRAALGVSGNIILSLTAHCVDRGSPVLLEACMELWRSGLDFTLVLAGPVQSDFEPFLNSAAGRIRPGRLIVPGYIRAEDRAEILAAADVVALPSRLDCFGIVVLEAWLLGKPVVGCWSGAMAEMIVDGRNGFLAGFGDAPTLADRLARLLGDPAARASMGACGRDYVLSERTWGMVTDRFYRRIAECIPARQERREPPRS